MDQYKFCRVCYGGKFLRKKTPRVPLYGRFSVRMEFLLFYHRGHLRPGYFYGKL